jgi:S-adenosyl-L-methionine hydrolase (adenosine-forming)
VTSLEKFLCFNGYISAPERKDLRMPIITLVTDFGLKDGNVGVMKGVILSICPQAQIVDLSHLIAPQNIREAALILARSQPYFPPGSIHVVVVDPGVGTPRRPLASRIDSHYFVLPDNGLLTQVLEKAERQRKEIELVHLDKPEYWLEEISHVFHGRDIFAPVAAHLALGLPLTELGTPLDDPVRLQLPHPQPTDRGFLGEVIHIDHFGNIALNIYREHLDGVEHLEVDLRSVKIRGLVKTFGDATDSELIALYGSTGNLIVSVVNGSAAQRVGACIGDRAKVTILD